MSPSARSTAQLIAFLMLLAGAGSVYWSLSCDTDRLGAELCQADRASFGPIGWGLLAVSVVIFIWAAASARPGNDETPRQPG